MAGLIQRGEIWLVDLDPGFGREIHKKRPAIIISTPSVIQQTQHAVIIPLSSIVPKQIGVEMVLIKQKEGLDKVSVALPVFIRSIDHSRLIKKVGILTEDKMTQVEHALKLIIEMSEET